MAQSGQIKYQEDGKLHYKNTSGATLPIRSIVVIGERLGIINSALADDEVGVADIVGIWPMPVKSTLTPAAGDVLGWDAADGEFNDDLVNNTIHAVVAASSLGGLCPTAGMQWMHIG